MIDWLSPSLGKQYPLKMATSRILSTSFVFNGTHSINDGTRRNNVSVIFHRKSPNFKVQAAKLPAGVELPKEQPKFNPPFLGFTKTAEIWNSRACMIGLIGTFIVELILNKGVLQIIGVEVGKGLNLPL